MSLEIKFTLLTMFAKIWCFCSGLDFNISMANRKSTPKKFTNILIDLLLSIMSYYLEEK